MPQSWIFDNAFLMGEGARQRFKLPPQFARTGGLWWCVCVRLACRQLLLLHAYVTSTLLQQDSFDHDGDGVRLCQYSSRQLHETMASEHFRLLAGSLFVH